jgi:hypothetical protein
LPVSTSVIRFFPSDTELNEIGLPAVWNTTLRAAIVGTDDGTFATALLGEFALVLPAVFVAVLVEFTVSGRFCM